MQNPGKSGCNGDLVELIRARAALEPARVAYRFLRFDGDSRHETLVSLSEVDARAQAFAAVLQAQVAPGDRVVILGSQSIEDVVAVVGCLYARAVFCLVPPPTDAAQAQRLRAACATATPRLVVASQGLLAAMSAPLDAALAGTGIERLAVVDQPRPAPRWQSPPLPPPGIALLQYTSGSTSAPKPIAVTHENVIHNVGCFLAPPAEIFTRTYASWAPFFHNVGLMTLFMPLLGDVEITVMSPRDFMARPARWLEAISQHRIGGTFAPHSGYAHCVNAVTREELERLDLTCLTIALNGAEPIELPALRAFADKFASAGFDMACFAPAYGLGECTSGVTRAAPRLVSKLLDADELLRHRAREVDASHPHARVVVSVGQAMSGLSVVAVNPASRRGCPPGQVGELWIQGPSVAHGYWNDRRATDETFGAERIDAPGTWLRTGDLGVVIDAEVYVTGRSKDLLIVNGRNIYPRDVEAVLTQSLPDLRGARVLTFSYQEHARAQVVCLVELGQRSSEVLAAVPESVVKCLARAFGFAPADVLVVPERSLPRTPNGKLQLHRARELYASGGLSALSRLRKPSDESNPSAPAVNEQLSDDERGLAELFCAILKRPSVTLDDDFYALGGTSLEVSQLASELAIHCGVDVPLKQLLDAPTVRGISRAIGILRRQGFMDASPAHIEELTRDSVLDSAIVPPSGAPPTRPENILLTGATGFVGAYLVRELLQATNAALYCHVRAASPEHARDRLEQNLRFYGLWDEAYRARLVPVLGDLALPRLGMVPSVYANLSERLDAIYHGGALLNFVYPYRRLAPANVAGTKEALRLACTGSPKRFHHLSTFSVYDNPSFFRRVAREDDPLLDPRGYLLGYSESKWAAEKLVRAAFERGLSGSIVRPGEVTAASETGIWKLSDLVIRALLASVQAQAFPEGSMRFHMTPVDYVARAIVGLSLAETPLRCFNLINQNVATQAALANMVMRLGYPVEVVAFTAWKQRLLALDDASPFKPLESLLKEQKTGDERIEERYGSAEASFSVANTEAVLSPLGITCPPVDQQLISTYFRGFRNAGYLPPSRG